MVWTTYICCLSKYIFERQYNKPKSATRQLQWPMGPGLRRDPPYGINYLHTQDFVNNKESKNITCCTHDVRSGDSLTVQEFNYIQSKIKQSMHSLYFHSSDPLPSNPLALELAVHVSLTTTTTTTAINASTITSTKQCQCWPRPIPR